MEIIPVLDLMQGQVVRAQRGNRQFYRPIRSQLCDSSEPERVAETFLQLYPFKSLYIADLDAILGSGNNFSIIAALRERFSNVKIWLDAGVSQPEQINAMMDIGLSCIIASERIESMAHYEQMITRGPGENTLLSLDFGPSGFLGPAQLLDTPDNWPGKLICMSLSRVGSYEGPDIAKLNVLIAKAGQRKIYAAGGVRGPADMEDLAQAGVSGVLLASVLHDQKIGSSDIMKWNKKTRGKAARV